MITDLAVEWSYSVCRRMARECVCVFVCVCEAIGRFWQSQQLFSVSLKPPTKLKMLTYMRVSSSEDYFFLCIHFSHVSPSWEAAGKDRGTEIRRLTSSRNVNASLSIVCFRHSSVWLSDAAVLAILQTGAFIQRLCS